MEIQIWNTAFLCVNHKNNLTAWGLKQTDQTLFIENYIIHWVTFICNICLYTYQKHKTKRWISIWQTQAIFFFLPFAWYIFWYDWSKPVFTLANNPQKNIDIGLTEIGGLMPVISLITKPSMYLGWYKCDVLFYGLYCVGDMTVGQTSPIWTNITKAPLINDCDYNHVQRRLLLVGNNASSLR